MGKLEKLRKELEEERVFTREQAALHEKHEEIPEDTVIVEKSSAVRSTLSFIKSLGRALAGTAFILLAATGILTLLYPETREALSYVLSGTLAEIKTLI